MTLFGLGGAGVASTSPWASAGLKPDPKKPFKITKMPCGTQVLWPDHCVQVTADAALRKDLDNPHAQVIVRKGFHKDMDSCSAFLEAGGKTPTGLSAYLEQRGIQRLFVTGLATDFCVACTAMDAGKAGFETWVIDDASRAAIDLNGTLAAAWVQMAKKGVKRSQSKDLTLA